MFVYPRFVGSATSFALPPACKRRGEACTSSSCARGPTGQCKKRMSSSIKSTLARRFPSIYPCHCQPATSARALIRVWAFWERFSCQHCGRCCYTPGAGLLLEKEDFERIAAQIGKKTLKSMCRYHKGLHAWILKQPCPFYSPDEKKCQIYAIRPLTCTKYPLHPPLKEMPYNLAVDAFCPAARQFAKDTLGWWIICENNWAKLLCKTEER